MIIRMSSPCKECTDRFPGCHAKCQKYADYVAEKDDRKNQIYDAKKSEKILDDFLIGNHRKRREKSTGDKGGK